MATADEMQFVQAATVAASASNTATKEAGVEKVKEEKADGEGRGG